MSKTKKSKKSPVQTVRADVMQRAKEERGDPHILLPKKYLYIESNESVLILNKPAEEIDWLQEGKA